MEPAEKYSIALIVGFLLAASAGGFDGGVDAQLTDVRAARERSRDARLEEQQDRLVKSLRNAQVARSGRDLTVSFDVPAFFAFDSAELNPAVKDDLVALARTASSSPGITVRVEGYADSIGSVDYNCELSKRRADAVAAYLIDYGVPPDRVEAVGLGRGSADASSAAARDDVRIALKAPEPPPSLGAPGAPGGDRPDAAAPAKEEKT